MKPAAFGGWLLAYVALSACQARAEDVSLVVYYRVAKPQAKQVKTKDIEDVKLLLKKLHLTYVCGPSYYDGRLRVSRVPLGIHEKGWQVCRAKSESQRKKLIAIMSALGIESSTVKPDEDDD